MSMITLVGVGHVFDISAQVRAIILETAPVAVGLELDGNRLAGLLARDRGEELPRQRDMLARFQERIAKDFGVEAGDEMLAGYKAATEINAKVFVIDMDINRVIMRIQSQLTVKERLKMFGAIFATPFIRRKTVEKELMRYEEEGDSYLEEVGRSLPTVKRVLLDERNEHMAQYVLKIEERYGSVLALVGDGHVPGMARLMPHADVRTVRLKEVRNWKPAELAQASISYTFNA